MPKGKRGGKINAQFNSPPLAPVEIIKMTDHEKAKYKSKNEIELEPNQTQAKRQEEKTEQEIDKNTKTTKSEHDEETQRRRMNDNTLNRRQQQQQPRTIFNEGKTDTDESIQIDETRTRQAAEERLTTKKQPFVWDDEDDDTP